MATTRSLGLPLIAVVVALVAAGGAQAAQPPVGLGTADNFAVLAGAGITGTSAAFSVLRLHMVVFVSPTARADGCPSGLGPVCR